MRHEALPALRPSLALALLALPACRPATHAADASVEASTAAAAPPSLTLTFADRTEKFFTGEIQLRDLFDLATPLLALERLAPTFAEEDPGPWVHRPLAMPAHEDLEAQLVSLPPAEDGVREWQLQLRGPASSGPFLADAERRNLTISFGFDAAGEPLFCVGLLQDTVARTEEAFWRYQNLEAAPVGGAYKLGRSPEESYWRPITLRAELRQTSGAGDVEDWPGGATLWEYAYGAKAAAAPGRLADLGELRPLLE